VENYETVPNPLYNQYCGIITCSDSVINSGYITNHYTKFYDTETNLITDINFGDILGLEANSYLNNLNNFEQYLLINKERDFNKDDRNVILKQLILDIFTYNLIQRIHPRQISETIIERYTTAIETLRQIQRGDISINLKKYEGTEFQNNMSVRWGISKSGMRNSF
jgi:phage gp36-like protein